MLETLDTPNASTNNNRDDNSAKKLLLLTKQTPMKQAAEQLMLLCKRWRYIPYLSVGGSAFLGAAAAAIIYTNNTMRRDPDGRRTYLLSSSSSLARSSFGNDQDDDNDNNDDNNDTILASFERIPVDFVQKLAQKFYLQMPGILDRPPAIPRTLRLLTIDLPEVAEQGIAGGKCHTILDLYPAGVAPPRKRLILPAEAHTATDANAAAADDDDDVVVDTDAAGSSTNRKKKAAPKRHQTLEIQQKAWVQAYMQCTSRQQGYDVNNTSKKPRKKKTPKYSFDKGPSEDVGVEIMQASMITLNPRRLRKIHAFVPGSTDAFADDKANVEEVPNKPNNGASRTVVARHSSTGSHRFSSFASVKKLKTKPQQLTDLDELDAPWNQYAWIEELTLRIHGRVHFGEPLQRARRHSFFLSRLYYSSGNAPITKSYRTTIPSARPWWETWFIPPFFLRTDPEGIDGGLQYTDVNPSNNKSSSSSSSSHRKHYTSINNWASQKPHAVVANGATLHRVPNALRLLQKTCKDANVPLYVIRDPRKWGGNTHKTLGDVLQDLRLQLKHQFVTASLQFAAGKAFARGRWLGQIETNAAWHVKDVSRQATEWMQRAEEERKLRRERNWSRINDIDVLEDKLYQHGLVQRVNRPSLTPSSSSSPSSSLKEDSSMIERVYSEGMVAFCQRCVSEVMQQETKSATVVEKEESDLEVNEDETPSEATM